jgi:hypothetical protein
VINGFANCIRKNGQIVGNKIFASAKEFGSEGIGLASFDGAIIAKNEITGVGDDPVVIHFSSHVAIKNNTAKSVHGRVFVSNSSDVTISQNYIQRIESLSDGKFYNGIALIYIGFENQESNTYQAPNRIQIHGNYLHYPEGAIDQGAPINLNGVKNTDVRDNRVDNDSALVTATGLHLSPVILAGKWTDPDQNESGNIVTVWHVDVLHNVGAGKYPLGFIMTGNCINYKGKVIVRDNVAKEFCFYCDNTFLSNNRNN